MQKSHNNEFCTIEIDNYSNDDIKCFFFSEYIPNDNRVETSTLQINGRYNNGFTLEIGEPNGIYPGHTVYRWIMAEPYDGCSNLSIRPGQKYTITYQAASPVSNTWHSWVGWVSETNTPHFGYN